MVQRTIYTCLAAVHETHQQLDEEIACLRADPARRPPVIEAQNHRHSPSSTDVDTADGTRSQTSLRDILQQQKAMMATQLAALNNLVETSSSHRHPADVRSSGDHLTASTSRLWKLDMSSLQVPEDTDLSSFADWRKCWMDYVALIRVMHHVRISTAIQDLLCFVLHAEWTVLWQTGRLDVAPDDDIEGIAEKFCRYFRVRRNPCSTARTSLVASKRKTRTSTSTSHLSSASTIDARTMTTFRPAAPNVDMHVITAATSKCVVSVTGSSLVSATRACSEEYFLRTLAGTSLWITFCRFARPTSRQQTQAQP